ncbi:putative glucan 1,3-beta-glucosidase precursor [Aspergillus brunneoviolaceus CBS 621.78]|uniref:Glucan 1,3-beta-glucosidase n=1 Tax=Aspergillus brunneoviolaceus CBS 621.78 TaxID=1450534 RepID=A0ACD1FZX3_9EURO|nr:putative glucan 1,3-beta-glucosidase precursor [Aspergillus brunneoviolaceus CBS 621.78]RAH42502.1 putative glucan 1,3-beta-glucosidase precursor [Aspergillus brunneoviolaceus CBS 621.78]
MGKFGFALAALALPTALGAPTTSRKSSSYVNWRQFKAHGANLGGWLVQESTINSAWWAEYAGGASDEWGFCENLGQQCGPVFEEHYATWITTADVDKLAEVGITALRIPTTYAAWIHYPGSQLYSGNQTKYLSEIATYAIEQYGMHVIVDIHGLPGGTNGLTIGEATGHYGWWYNQTNFDYSLQAVDAVIDYIQNSGHPESYSLEPANEAVDNRDFSVFGTPAALTDKAAAWLLKYYQAVIDHVAAVNPSIPVMLQDSFKGERFWSGNFSTDANIVFDSHNYWFDDTNATSVTLAKDICTRAKSVAGDGKFPVFVGEWAIQAGSNNTFALRERNLNTGLHAFHQHTQGSSYWTAKFYGNGTVSGQGNQTDYWNFEGFIDLGLVHLDSKNYKCV